MFKSRIARLLRLALIVLLLGVIGIRLSEPTASWFGAMLWVEKILVSFDSDRYSPAASPLSDFFQTHFALAVFVVLTILLTEIIPYYIDRSNAPMRGLRPIERQWSRPLYLLVNPVDLEKVRSVHRALILRLPRARLVVVSETLPDFPQELLGDGVSWIKGCVREYSTYQKAGVDFAVGAFICAASYDNPEQDVTAYYILDLLESNRPELHTVVEVVSRGNLDLFTGEGGVNKTLVFDEITLQVVCAAIKRILGDQVANITVNKTVDRLQTVELLTQLKLAGVQRSKRDGVSVEIILPHKLDDPSLSDAEVKAKLKRSTATIRVALYLSVLSQDGFRRFGNATSAAICADGLMADRLVEAICTDAVVADRLVDTMLQ